MRLVHALLLLALTSPVLAVGEPEANMPPSAETRISVSIPDTLIVRVDESSVLPAQRAMVYEERQRGELRGVLLGFEMDRAELPKLRPPHFDMKVDGVTLLSFDPGRPVRVLARARPEFVKELAAVLGKGETLAAVAGRPGASGFPMLFDLENYTFHGVIQDQGGEE